MTTKLRRGPRIRTGEPDYSPHVTALAAAYARRTGVTGRAGQRRLERLTEELREFSAVASDVPQGVLRLARIIAPALAAMRGTPSEAVAACLDKSDADAAEDPLLSRYVANPTAENKAALIQAMHREALATSRALAALEAS